uniref:Ribosomal protein L37 n=1 Tax=Neogobius melanostomus TaxID=47308 RepID=A0A8C6WFQ7_9GOBI
MRFTSTSGIFLVGITRPSATYRSKSILLQELAIFTTVLTGAGVGTMYYLMQKRFAASEYHQLAVQKLEACSVAMESLGAPPLKVYNIHLTDRQNYINQHWAQIKIPVKGSKTGGYLYTSSRRDPTENRFRLLSTSLLTKKEDSMFLFLISV